MSGLWVVRTLGVLSLLSAVVLLLLGQGVAAAGSAAIAGVSLLMLRDVEGRPAWGPLVRKRERMADEETEV